MPSLKFLKDNIESHISMKGLVEVYEEMAATTMREIREAILGSRDYYHGLAALSAEVGADLSLLETLQTKKSAIVLLSSDEGMYGEIIDKVFGQFVTKARSDKNIDVYVAGRIGRELMAVVAPEIKYTSLQMPKLTGSAEIIKQIGAQLFHYRSVELLFGQFHSIAKQEASSRILSASSVELTSQDWAGEINLKLKFLYEPSPKQISTVFGEQIFSGILEQTIKEGELAKNASRLMHLDQALTNIDQKLDSDLAHYHTLKKRIAGKKQHTQVAGYRGNLKNKQQRAHL